MVTSLCMHGPIEHGRDVTDSPSVNNAFTSVNVLGVPNVVDSMFAIKKVVFEDRRFTLAQLKEAMEVNWQGHEIVRQVMLNQEKFGNDLDGVDEMYVRVANQVLDTLEHKRNIKGFTFRPSLFQYMGHTYAGPMMGATPDGRRAEEPLAHGCNPMHGRNVAGITATANSLMKVDFARFQGGSLQIELQPKFFDGKDNIGSLHREVLPDVHGARRGADQPERHRSGAARGRDRSSGEGGIPGHRRQGHRVFGPFRAARSRVPEGVRRPRELRGSLGRGAAILCQVSIHSC
jgi:hypothetical protein